MDRPNPGIEEEARLCHIQVQLTRIINDAAVSQIITYNLKFEDNEGRRVTVGQAKQRALEEQNWSQENSHWRMTFNDKPFIYMDETQLLTTYLDDLCQCNHLQTIYK